VKHRCLEQRCGIEFDEPLSYPAGVNFGGTRDCPQCGSSKTAVAAIAADDKAQGGAS
jgi:hypothetical protein